MAHWTYEDVPVPDFMYRGYTGHEHLDPFGLINLLRPPKLQGSDGGNGRMLACLRQAGPPKPKGRRGV